MKRYFSLEPLENHKFDFKQRLGYRFWHLYTEGTWQLGFLPLEHTVRHTQTETGVLPPPLFLSFWHLCDPQYI